MTNPEMHIMFRQYAQQMGMQNNRAILPEQIDLLINTSITDTVNQIIKENIGITNDRVITDNSKIGQINILRTLYKVKIFDLIGDNPIFNLDIKDSNIGKISTSSGNKSIIPDYNFLVDFSINYGKAKTGYNFDKGYKLIHPLKDNYYFSSGSVPDYIKIDIKNIFNVANYPAGSSITTFSIDTVNSENCYMANCGLILGYANTKKKWFLVNKTELSINSIIAACNVYWEDKTESTLNDHYATFDIFTESDYTSNTEIENEITNYFPVRLIDDSYLADTLNDFVLKNRIRSPILTIYNNDIFDLYIDSFIKKDIGYVLKNNLIPYQFRMSYIAKPAKVFYGEDLGQPNVDCDLPEYTHVDIVKHAVDLYRISISGSMMAVQNQEQNANQENMRNNYRNEGYNNNIN